MKLEVRKLESMTPEALFNLLHRKHLLTLPVRNNPALLAAVALNSDFYALTEDGQPVAWLIESRTLEPGILDLALIPEDKSLNLHAEALLAVSEELRNRWFVEEGWQKVQAQIALSRKNACRTLRALGFVCETRSIGIRKGITLNKEAEPLMIYGLLPSDPLPVILKEEVAHAEE